jgi:hypothetical protein
MRVGVQVEEVANPVHDRHQCRVPRGAQLDDEMLTAFGRTDPNPCRRVAEAEASLVRRGVDSLDTGDGSKRQEAEQRSPVERRTVRGA